MSAMNFELSQGAGCVHCGLCGGYAGLGEPVGADLCVCPSLDI